MGMIFGIFIALVLGFLGWIVFKRWQESGKFSDPMTKTRTGKTHSGFENQALNKRIYSKVTKKRKKGRKSEK